MKKTLIATLGVLVVVGLSLAIFPTTRDEIHWRWASYTDDTTSYGSYVQARPKGRHAAEAQSLYDERSWADTESINSVRAFERYVQLHGEGKHLSEAKENIESLHWQEAMTGNSVQGFERYVQLHGEGKHLSEAKENIESLHWQEATAANTMRSYRAYSATYPTGAFAQQAKTKTSALRADPAPYDAARRIGTEVALRKFLTDYPGHQRESDGQQALKDVAEGRDIVDLLSEKKIEIETQGSGIKSVQVRVRKMVPYPVTVRVPVGSYFVSARQSAQNMVTTAESKVRLGTDAWKTLSVPAACANRPRDIPGRGDSFTVQRSPQQAELVRLMPELDKARAQYAVRQAAVWIVTDNADYGDLGILVSRSQFQVFGGTRQIKEYEAAKAMKICDEAGIDVKKKAIWRDRKRILTGLEDEKLKKWLESKR